MTQSMAFIVRRIVNRKFFDLLRPESIVTYTILFISVVCFFFTAFPYQNACHRKPGKGSFKQKMEALAYILSDKIAPKRNSNFLSKRTEEALFGPKQF